MAKNVLELEELKRLHDKGFNSGQVTREQSAHEIAFYYISQWGADFLEDSQLAVRFQFDLLKKCGRGIMADLAALPVQPDFEPEGDTTEEVSELLDGLYRRGANLNASKEAKITAQQEAVVCGVGAWKLYTKYRTNKMGDKRQVICRKPVYEANNNLIWDPNAKTIDKRDAKYCSELIPFSKDGYLDLVEKMTGERPDDIDTDSFKNPEHSYTFPWLSGEGEKIYVVDFYHKTKEEDKALTMVDPFGETMIVSEMDLKDKDVMDDLLDSGFEIESEKVVERSVIRKYVASGAEILNGDINPETGERMGEVIAGPHIPVVPYYGEYAMVEGEVHYEGIVRVAKDPQMLRNFILSYMADIASRSPRTKPIFLPEQLSTHEDMYETSGADNNYPYVYQNKTDGMGNELPLGPVGQLPEQPIPTSLIALTELTRQSVEDVAPSGLPGEISDIDLSGKAVIALQNKIEANSSIYQEHGKFAERRDAEIFAGMASVVLDVPQTVKIELPDGTKKDAEIMQSVYDADSGEIVVVNDLRDAEFEVSAKISSDYSSQKEQTLERLEKNLAITPPTDPMFKILQLKIMILQDGVDMTDVREYARKQLIVMGVIEPDTDEEKAMMEQQAQAAQEPDAMMVAAQAEMVKGKAAMLKEQREGIEMQLTAQNKEAQTKIDAFKAQTGRMDTQIDAQEANAKITNTNIDSFGKKIDNQAKIIQLSDIQQFTDEQILQQIAQG